MDSVGEVLDDLLWARMFGAKGVSLKRVMIGVLVVIAIIVVGFLIYEGMIKSFSGPRKMRHRRPRVDDGRL